MNNIEKSTNLRSVQWEKGTLSSMFQNHLISSWCPPFFSPPKTIFSADVPQFGRRRGLRSTTTSIDVLLDVLDIKTESKNINFKLNHKNPTSDRKSSPNYTVNLNVNDKQNFPNSLSRNVQNGQQTNHPMWQQAWRLATWGTPRACHELNSVAGLGLPGWWWPSSGTRPWRCGASDIIWRSLLSKLLIAILVMSNHYLITINNLSKYTYLTYLIFHLFSFKVYLMMSESMSWCLCIYLCFVLYVYVSSIQLSNLIYVI